MLYSPPSLPPPQRPQQTRVVTQSQSHVIKGVLNALVIIESIMDV